jgi:integrase/recombinase XerD
VLTDKQKIELEEILLDYRDHLITIRSLRENTAETYIRRINLLVKFLDKPVAEISLKDLTNYNLELRSRNCSINYLRLSLSSWKSFFGWYAKQFDGTNIAEPIRALKEEVTFPSIPNKSEVLRMIRVYDVNNQNQLRNAALLAILADTGMRVSEVVKLTVGDIKKEGNQFIVTVPRTKGSRQRMVPFAYLIEGGFISELWSLYWMYVRISCQRKLNEPLFQKSADYLRRHYDVKNKGITTQAVRLVFKKTCQRANIDEGYSPHAFRHFYATYLAADDTNIILIKDRLGHSNVETTMKYIHFADLISSDSAKHSPLAGEKSERLTGLSKIMKGI